MMVIKKIIQSATAVSLAFSFTQAHAGILNDKEKLFWDTQSGSYLHAMYPLMKPEEAVKAAIGHLVTTHKSFIEEESKKTGHLFFDYTKSTNEIDMLYNQVEDFLLKEIEYKDTHCIFYHGFGSGMTAYNAMLYELMNIADMKDLGKAHPLHYKNSELKKIKNMHDFLDKDRYHNAHLKNVQELREKAISDPENYGIYKNLQPFNYKKNIGVGKAPDNAPYARDHLKSVNLSLFGNSENSGESSFLFYLISGNIGKLDGFLTTRLLKEVGILSDQSTQEEINAKLAMYQSFFAEKMSASGGGMMQIMMKNEIVDTYSYASWAKGVPYFMHKKNGKFALRGHNDKAIPLLKNGSKELVRPSLLKMIQLYKKDAHGFAQKFSFDGKVLSKNIDRAQARLFINPDVFANKNHVIVNKIYKNKVDPQDEIKYKKNVSAQLFKDLKNAVEGNKLGKDFSNNTLFGQCMNYIFGKNVKPESLFQRLSKVTSETFSGVINMAKEIATQVQDGAKIILKKIEKLELFQEIKEKFRKMGKKAKNFIQKLFFKE